MCQFCSVENAAFVGWGWGFATFVVDSLKRVLLSVCGLQNDPEAIEKIDCRNHYFQFYPRTYYIPQFISLTCSQCSNDE